MTGKLSFDDLSLSYNLELGEDCRLYTKTNSHKKLLKVNLTVTCSSLFPTLTLISGDHKLPRRPRRFSRAVPGERSLICLVCSHVSGRKTILLAHVAALMLINTGNIHHI